MNEALRTMDIIKALEPIYCSDSSCQSLKDLLCELEACYWYSGNRETKDSESECVIPDQKYVRSLIENVAVLQKNSQSIDYELKVLEDGLETVLRNDDFDDPEEIMGQVHELINKYIYRSDSKVTADEWRNLEQFLIQAGYQPVTVAPGNSINPFKKFFERPIPAYGGIPDTIKQIQLKPYTLCYFDGDKPSTLTLFGKCTYYKS